MNIIPAIDLYQGDCVRLTQGRFDAKKIYPGSALDLAKGYEAQGAKYLHLVNLQGAKTGKISSEFINTLIQIKENTQLSIQSGGGLRNKEDIVSLLERGIDRVVLGSIACKQPRLIEALIEQYGVQRIILAFDIKMRDEPMLAIHGWQALLEKTLWSQLDDYQAFPGLQILCTDIAQDGMLNGPNFSLYQQCISQYPELRFQASGGIRDLTEIARLEKLGAAAVIIGKAFYEDYFSVAQALAEVA